eukprot:3093120-Amphidinium_carterae.1
MTISLLRKKPPCGNGLDGTIAHSSPCKTQPFIQVPLQVSLEETLLSSCSFQGYSVAFRTLKGGSPAAIRDHVVMLLAQVEKATSPSQVQDELA